MTVPPLRPGMVPAFHELGDDLFEDLCREVTQEEEDVATVERYGTSGQKQLGIDLLIEYRDNALAAGQCKSHKHCDEQLLKEACDTFLKHADHWRTEGVRTFILYLAADTRRTQLHDERLIQRERLRKAGFSFRVWSGAVFKAKLRKRRHIVRHFFLDLENYICGPSMQLDIQASVHQATIAALARQLGEVAEGDHAELRKLWQEGHPQEALRRLRSIKSAALTWAYLPTSQKAKLLRLEARLVLTGGDIATAKDLSAEADSVDKSLDSGRARLIAMIAQAENRLDDAVEALDHDSDPDSQSLKAAIQIQARRIDAAIETLAPLKSHADAYRLLSLVFLSRREPLRAKVEAEKALSLAPHSYWIRRTVAMVRYLAGIAPVVLPAGFPEWPEPTSPSLVRMDDESVAARRSAAIEFEQISGVEFDHSADELACIQTWRVACLADNPDSRREAEQLARTILESNPSNYRVLTWVLGRGLDVAVGPSVEALKERLQQDKAGVEEIATLMAAYASASRFGEAKSVLEQTKEVFARQSALPLWEFWQTQLAEIPSVTDDSADENATLERLLARFQAAEAVGDCEASWRKYMVLARLGRWEELAPIAAGMVTSWQTPEAARIASHALYNTHDFAGCLVILDQAPSLCFKGDLPLDLRRLRALAQRGIGALPDAIRTAHELFEQLPTGPALMELARLCFQIGDLKRLAIVARSHATIADLSSADCLTLAYYLEVEDAALALALWSKASAAGIADEHVGMAFEIGNTLGMGPELKPLVHRLMALGRSGKGGVEAVGLKELMDRSSKRHQQLEQVWRQLRAGEIPNHIGLAITGIGMARAFHRVPLLTSARTDGSSAGPVNQRFGGRITGALPSGTEQKWRLNADLTAILNAAHFDLLPLIEGEFSPIRLPQNTVLAISAMQNHLRPGQPRHVEALRQVLSLVSAGAIKRLDLEPITYREASDGDTADDILQLLRSALASASFVLDFLPIRSIDALKSAEAVGDSHKVVLRDAHSVVDALRQCGALSPAEHQGAIERLGERIGLLEVATIPVGKQLICRSAIAKLLALAGVLELAAATFKLAIPAGELDADQREVDSAVIADADASWLGRLVEHIREGLTSGTFELLPQMSDRESSATERHRPTAEESVLLDLMQFTGGDSDVIWLDDRWATALEQRDGIRIVGTIDLLIYLKEIAHITAETLADTLTEMRAADVRFIAFDAAELCQAVREAPVENGRLVETKSLRVMRQYYARCLVDAEFLRPPAERDQLPNSAAEWNFLFGCGSAVATAIVDVWTLGSSDLAVVRAEWLLRNMYTDDRGVHGTGAARTRGNDRYRASVSLVSLMATSIRLDGQKGLRQARRDYLRWLYRRVIRGHFAADSDLATEVVAQLKETMTRSLSERDDKEMAGVRLRLMGRLWSDLPQELRSLLEPDQAFLRAIGVSMKSVLEIGPLQMERQPFWDNLSRVLKERIPTAFETLDGHVVHLGFISDSPILFSCRCDDLQFDRQIGGHEFGFLSESFSEREASAARLAHWFDAPKVRREELVAQIIGGQDPSTRIELATEARRNSGEELYRRVFESLQPGGMFNPLKTLPNAPEVLLNHLRLTDADVSPQWAEVAERLIVDVGIAEAAQRLGGLPVAFSDAFAAALAALPVVERRQSLRTIRKIWLASPVGIVHLASLWARLPHASSRTVQVRTRLANLFCTEGHRRTFEAWHAALRWADEQFGFSARTRALPSAVRMALVWSHADRLFRILLTCGLPPDWIKAAFEQSDYMVDPELVFPHPAHTDDVAAPRRLHAEVFALAALSVICISPDTVTTIQPGFDTSLGGMNDVTRARLVASMMADSSRASNHLHSWLGDRGGWLTLFPDEVAKHFTNEGITKTVAEACIGIAGKDDERRHWFNLRAVLSEFPPAELTRLVMEPALSAVDLVDYVRRDPMLAIAAIGVMASQAPHVSAVVRSGIQAQLIAAAVELGKSQLATETQEEISDSILAGLVGCSWWEPDGEARAATLAVLFERLASDNASLVLARSGQFILKLCDALPADQARHFWKVRNLLRVRTQL